MIAWALSAILVLHPTLAQETDVRFVAAGAPDGSYDWYMDGAWVGTSADGEALHSRMDAGAHEVTVQSDQTGPWRALVRPDPPGDGIAYVPGWSATAAAEPDERAVHPLPVWPGLLATASILLVASRRRPKRP